MPPLLPSNTSACFLLRRWFNCLHETTIEGRLLPPPPSTAPPLTAPRIGSPPPRLADLQGCLPLLVNLVTLDLSENELTDLNEVLSVCGRMRYLKNLELMGARIECARIASWARAPPQRRKSRTTAP